MILPSLDRPVVQVRPVVLLVLGFRVRLEKREKKDSFHFFVFSPLLNFEFSVVRAESNL